MKNQIKPQSITKLFSRSLRRRGFVVMLTVSCLALLPARAVTPPPDGGYPGQNTAEGDDALFGLTTGISNVAVGFQALYTNTTGNWNTATGTFALTVSTTGIANTADGYAALNHNTTGGDNTASGYSALYSNTAGSNNTAAGDAALANNTTGSFNTANGLHALFANTIGNSNTAGGEESLKNNTTGNSNIALGFQAGSALTIGSNNIDIGSRGLAGEGQTIRIGNTQGATFIAGISGATVAGGVGVIVDSSGHLGTVVSSERFKDKIEPMDRASEAILSLQPVRFRYKKELDPKGIPQFGLVAEQVEKVNPDLVARDEAGKPYTVRYEAVNAMLLNEFLKEHRKVAEQEATIAQLKAADARQETTIAQQQHAIAALTASLSSQASEIKKVSEQLAAIQPLPRLVNSH